MKQVKTTIILSAIAVVSLITATSLYYFAPDREDSQNELIGEVFYPDFVDPLQAASLKLIVWDGENRETREFAVRKTTQKRLINGQEKEIELWTIPSHNNYPVESSDRLRDTAESVLNVTRLSLASNSQEEHERLGVIDPQDEDAQLKESAEVGDRIILQDDSGNTICDLIIGKAVDAEPRNEVTAEEQETVGGARYYVRQPDQNETYIARLDLRISTEFSQWIDEDLLQVGDANVEKIQFLNYEVQDKLIEKFGGRVPVRQNFEEFVVEKENGVWTIDDLKSDTEQLDTLPLNSLTSDLSRLTILEVQPKPTYQDNETKILNPDLTVNAPEGMSRNEQIQIQQQVLRPQGFIIGLEDENQVKPALLSTNGELKFATDDGIVYHLVFGYDVELTGEQLEFAAGEESPDDSPENENGENENGETAKSENGASANDPASDPKGDKGKKGKIMSVYVKFDPSLIEKPQEPVKPVPPEKPEINLPAPNPATTQPARPEPPSPDLPAEEPKPAENQSGEDKPGEGKKAEDKPADDPSKPQSAAGDAQEKAAGEPSKEQPAENAPPAGEPGSPGKSEGDPEKSSGDNAGLNRSLSGSPVVYVAADQPQVDALQDSDPKPGQQQEKNPGEQKQEEKQEKTQQPEKQQEQSTETEPPAKQAAEKPADTPAEPGKPTDEDAVDPASEAPGNQDGSLPQDAPQPPVQEPAAEKTPEEIFLEQTQAYNRAMEQYEAELQAYEEQMKEYQEAMEAYEKKLKESEQKVADLNSRFADWFYIVDAEDLEKVKLTRSDLVQPKEEDAAGGSQPPMGLPPGLNFPGGNPIPNLDNLPGNPSGDQDSPQPSASPEPKPGKEDPGKEESGKEEAGKEGPGSDESGAKADPSKPDPAQPAATPEATKPGGQQADGQEADGQQSKQNP